MILQPVTPKVDALLLACTGFSTELQSKHDIQVQVYFLQQPSASIWEAVAASTYSSYFSIK